MKRAWAGGSPSVRSRTVRTCGGLVDRGMDDRPDLTDRQPRRRRRETGREARRHTLELG